MSKEDNRKRFPDIAKLVDDCREYMSVESVDFKIGIPEREEPNPRCKQYGYNPPFVKS